MTAPTEGTGDHERAPMLAFAPRVPPGASHQSYRGPHLKPPVLYKDRLVSGLGWFSNGLGLVAAASPGRLARMIGVEDSGAAVALLRVAGVREIASGVGILARPRPTPWLWARVAGDALDLTFLLGAMLSGAAHRKRRTATALVSVAGITALDIQTAMRASRAEQPEGLAQVRQTITIGRPVGDVYEFWRAFEHLPSFMTNLESVTVTSDGRSHWRARGPAGRTVEWDSEVLEDRPSELIAWRATPGSQIRHAGEVRFRGAPGNRGTEVQVDLQYAPPGGIFGQTVARLFSREPGQQVDTDLRRLKQVLEAREVIRSDATAEGATLIQRPAQPLQAAA